MQPKVEMPVLRLAWTTHEAAKYAVMHWHYSKAVPAAKLVKVGVWENGQYKGIILFGRGSNKSLGKPYGLGQTECAELVRIALDKHVWPVTRMVSIALRMLKAAFPGIRLVVSFADSEQGHLGRIYQAGNWLYSGRSPCIPEYVFKGKRIHGRSARAFLIGRGLRKGTTMQRLLKLDPNAREVKGSSKFRYLMPLDDAMKRHIEPLRKPHPRSLTT